MSDTQENVKKSKPLKPMKLKLPDGKVLSLDKELPIEEKLENVRKILDQYENEFLKSLHTNKTRVCLEILSNYIVFHKEEEDKNKKDEYILSEKRIREMESGTRSSPFSTMSDKHKALFGMIGSD